MSTGRAYTVDSGLVTVASTSSTALLVGSSASTVTADIQAIRISVGSGSGVSYPSNGTVQALLTRTTVPGGGAAVTARPHNVQDIAANTTWLSGSTAITGSAAGNVLWGQNLPFTAGANWAEWVTPGDEWRNGGAGAAAYIGVFILCSSAGTATQFQCELVFAE